MDIIITVCAGIPEQVWSTIWDRSGVAENKNKKKKQMHYFPAFHRKLPETTQDDVYTHHQIRGPQCLFSSWDQRHKPCLISSVLSALNHLDHEYEV